jgi:hypothetical protein
MVSNATEASDQRMTTLLDATGKLKFSLTAHSGTAKDFVRCRRAGFAWPSPAG